jgi:aspartyl protease family protein
VTLDRVCIGDTTVRYVRAVVAKESALDTNLLGMSFLGRLSIFHVKNGELVLIESQDRI